MKHLKRTMTFLIICLFSLAIAGTSTATPIALDFVFDGTSLGNTAKVEGTLVIDDAILTTNQALLVTGDTSWIDLTVTVSGASFINGVFTKPDLSSVIWREIDGLDFTQELVGQSLASGGIFGQGTSGDFNLFGSHMTGVWNYTLQVGSDHTLLTSMVVTPLPVPEPSALVLFGAGLVGCVVFRKKLQS